MPSKRFFWFRFGSYDKQQQKQKAHPVDFAILTKEHKREQFL